MAGQSEKKRKERNDWKLGLLRTLLLAGLAIFVSGRATRYAVFGHALSLNVALNAIFGVFGSGFMYSWLQSLALNGSDLDEKGMTAYMLDTFYLGIFTLLLGAVYDRAWTIVAVILTLAGAYLAISAGKTIMPYLSALGLTGGKGKGDQSESEDDKKRRERQEKRRENRRRIKY